MSKSTLSTRKAREILWTCDRSVDDKWEVSWNTRFLQTGADPYPLIAIGTARGDSRQIKILESAKYLETTFKTGDAQFETLWSAGRDVTNRPALSTSKALGLLEACNRTSNLDKWEVEWSLSIAGEHLLIAVSTSIEDLRQITFQGTHNYRKTTFKTGDEGFENLWSAGRHIPQTSVSPG